MANITTSGNKITIELEVAKDGKLSSTGKTYILGGTGGNKKITMDDGTVVFVGATVFKKKES